MKTLLTFVHALSSLHAGIGQGAGVIDLPIARESATGIPILPGSSLKGALRTRCPDSSKEIFGSDPSDTEKQTRASSVLFTDQRLLLLPVRSVAGTFAWVTSPYVLYRFMRDVAEVGGQAPTLQLATLRTNACLLTTNSKLLVDLHNVQQSSPKQEMVYLEDFDLAASKDAALSTWSEWLAQRIFANNSTWQTLLKERLCLVPDDIFNFMSEHSTEIITRIKLQEGTKTVEEGGLWYEEALPTETVLSGLLVIAPPQDIQQRYGSTKIVSIVQDLASTALQLGGKATVGRGLCHIRVVEGA